MLAGIERLLLAWSLVAVGLGVIFALSEIELAVADALHRMGRRIKLPAIGAGAR